MIDNFLNRDFTKSNEGIKDAVNQVQQIILKAAKSSLKLKLVKSRTKIRKVTPKKWFDRDCNMKRIALCRLSNQKHRDPLNASIRIISYCFKTI